MPVSLATLPDSDRPRERLWSLGTSALTSVELLAILLGTGSGLQSSLEVAATLLSRMAVPVVYYHIARRGRAEALRQEGLVPQIAA